MNDGGDCRTAPATPGLLRIGLGVSPVLVDSAAVLETILEDDRLG